MKQLGLVVVVSVKPELQYRYAVLVMLQLQPMCDDWEYLEDQHLLLAVKTADGLESYGLFPIISFLFNHIYLSLATSLSVNENLYSVSYKA